MKNIVYSLVFLLFVACSQDIDLDLPTYEPRLTIEFYLEEGRPIRAFLQESLNYTDERIINTMEGATVILRYKNQMDTLQNRIFIDSAFNKVYNYFNPKIFYPEHNVDYHLYVKDKQGRELFSTARYSDPVKIDSIAYDFNQEGEARIGLVFTDPREKINFYRIVAFPADTVITEDETWDFSLSDNSFNGDRFSFFTGFTFKNGRKVIARLYNLDPKHNEFAESVSTARQSNFNPFGQPAPLRGNIIGGHGIFTILSYDEVLVTLVE